MFSAETAHGPLLSSSRTSHHIGMLETRDVTFLTGCEHERRGHEVARYRRRCWPVRLKYETKRSNATSSRASMSLSSSSKILFESLRLSITPGAAAAAAAEPPRRAAFPSVPAAAAAALPPSASRPPSASSGELPSRRPCADEEDPADRPSVPTPSSRSPSSAAEGTRLRPSREAAACTSTGQW